jgi:two-component system response regulator FlrC
LALRHAPQGKAIPWISEAALSLLKVHGWPGNVRELENVVRRALLLAEGRFRADLFYRLNVFPLGLRPLRERADDIAPLAFALALRHSAPGRSIPWISEAALSLLKVHGWPGNVRELENVVRRALLLADGKAEIGPEHIVFDGTARLVPGEMSAPMIGGLAPEMPRSSEPAGGKRLSNIVQLSEARAIMATLEACGGSRVQAARQLGISERTLRYRLASFREAGLAVAGGRR